MAKISRRLRPVPTRPRLVHGVRGPLRLFPASGASSLSLGRLPEPKSIGSRTPVPQNEKSPGAGASPRRSVYTVVPIRSGVGAARRQESASRGDVHAARHGCEQHGDRPGHGVRRRPLPAHVGWTPLRWRERRCVDVAVRAGVHDCGRHTLKRSVAALDPRHEPRRVVHELAGCGVRHGEARDRAHALAQRPAGPLPQSAVGPVPRGVARGRCSGGRARKEGRTSRSEKSKWGRAGQGSGPGYQIPYMCTLSTAPGRDPGARSAD